MKRSIITTLAGIFVMVLYLVWAIQSYSKENDGWGTNTEMNMDYFVLAICGIIILIVGLYDLYVNVKANGADVSSLVKKDYIYGGLLLGAITSIYPLGLMFKSIAKEEGSTTIVNYLLCFIFGAFILAYSLLAFLDFKKKEN